LEVKEGLGEGEEEPPFRRAFTLRVRAAVVAMVELACR
jgi:hypothetical protein